MTAKEAKEITDKALESEKNYRKECTMNLYSRVCDVIKKRSEEGFYNLKIDYANSELHDDINKLLEEQGFIINEGFITWHS